MPSATQARALLRHRTPRFANAAVYAASRSGRSGTARRAQESRLAVLMPAGAGMRIWMGMKLV